MAVAVSTTSMQVVVTTTMRSTNQPYPEGVPYKFSPDGDVQRFPGNTTLCHVPIDSTVFVGLQKLYVALSAHPRLSKRISLLPPASWHMTVVDGVCEEDCEPGMWPNDMEKQRLADSTAQFANSLRQLGNSLKGEDLAPPYHMKFKFYDANTVGLGFQVEGATVEEEARMRRLRDRLADAMGFRAPRHSTYGFHITVAYFLRHMDVEDMAELNAIFASLLVELDHEFDLGAVEFCTFENMHSFSRLFYIE